MVNKTIELQKIMEKRSKNKIIDTPLKLEYEIIKTYLTKASIEKVQIINPRKIHSNQVRSIYLSLLKGEHFDSIFVVNNFNNHNRIIDGNHRLMALKNYFKKYPNARIPVYFAAYTNLTEEQERKIFTRWNISVTQSTDDFINSYKETIPMYNRFISELPCNIYGSNNKMKLRDLVNAYSASFEKPYHGGESKTKLNFIQYTQRLKDYDMDILINNFNILREIFDADKRKDWRNQAPFKNIIFRALYFLIANNLKNLGESYIKRRMKTVLSNRTIMDDYRRYSGRRASVDAYIAFKNLLNDTDSDKKFI